MAQFFKCFGLIVSATALVIAGSGCGQGVAQQPQGSTAPAPGPSLNDFEAKVRDPNSYTAYDVDRMRKEHPYVSLADRLAYEEPAARRAAPKLSSSAEERLSEREKAYGDPDDNLRAKSLALLHTEEVEKFIAREGFGWARITPPGPTYIELPELQPVPLVQAPASAGDAPWTSAAPPVAKDSLLGFHDVGESVFASPMRFGHVRDRDHVAGFEAHGFGRMLRYKEFGPIDPATRARLERDGDPGGELKKKRWEITRMELVSLLKFPKPAVYVSRALPRMEDLREAETRPLTRFESTGLEKLQAGEDLDAHYTLNRIQMLGALRARRQCLECHSAHRGELLGAFSYELLRVPQRTPERTGGNPAAD